MTSLTPGKNEKACLIPSDSAERLTISADVRGVNDQKKAKARMGILSPENLLELRFEKINVDVSSDEVQASREAA